MKMYEYYCNNIENHSATMFAYHYKMFLTNSLALKKIEYHLETLCFHCYIITFFSQKINQKNAFALSLLDHLNQIVHQDGDKAPNFVSAGCTLDASIKIYSCRVDAVHSDTYRVWGGFSKSAPEFKEDADDEEGGQKEKSGGVHGFEDDEVDGDGDNSVLSVSSPTAKKSHKKRSSTIEAHPESLLQKKPENDISTDPFFQKMAASFDEGGAKGMMVATVNVQRACAMVIDSNARHDDAAASSAGDARADFLDAEELIDMFAKGSKLKSLTQRSILPSVEAYVW
jgi:condensin complex subunit 2